MEQQIPEDFDILINQLAESAIKISALAHATMQMGKNYKSLVAENKRLTQGEKKDILET